MIRLFTAIEIPEAVRERLLALAGGVPGARWYAGNQLHLTLRFIGEVSEAVARDIDDVLAAVRAPRFQMELAGVGEFGGKYPRALWAGVRDEAPVVHLQKKIESALQRLGLPAEERKFTPHVTLARLKNSPHGKVMDFLSHNGLFASGPFAVDRFTLFSSQLSSNGSIYRVEQNYELE